MIDISLEEFLSLSESDKIPYIKDYAILDFSKPRKFEEMFQRLFEGLKKFYGR